MNIHARSHAYSLLFIFPVLAFITGCENPPQHVVVRHGTVKDVRASICGAAGQCAEGYGQLAFLDEGWLFVMNIATGEKTSLGVGDLRGIAAYGDGIVALTNGGSVRIWGMNGLSAHICGTTSQVATEGRDILAVDSVDHSLWRFRSSEPPQQITFHKPNDHPRRAYVNVVDEGAIFGSRERIRLEPTDIGGVRRLERDDDGRLIVVYLNGGRTAYSRLR